MAKKAAIKTAAPKAAPATGSSTKARDEGRGLHQAGDEDRSFQEAGFHCL